MRLYVGDNEEEAVLTAVEDFQQDLLEVTGVAPPIGSYSGYDSREGFIICTLGGGDEPRIRAEYEVDTATLRGKRESFMIRRCDKAILIVGSDALGTVFGVYHACEHLVGVDPLRFWTEKAAVKSSLDEVVRRASQPIDWGPPAIPLRGWFINVEDLMRQFDFGLPKWDCDPEAITRGLRSPYMLISPGVYEAVISTMLRLKQNLWLAGSYPCPRDTLWRQIMTMGARRGLYNTTQHFQPVGCWPVSFDRYWEQRSDPQEYSWLSNRKALLEAWDAFASQMAPLRPVWQVGYRGQDDGPFWASEPRAPATMAERAAVVSEAIVAQVELIKRYDPNPLCTYFLWDEGDILYRSGELRLPDEVIVVFSDYGRTSMMKQGFWEYAGDGARPKGTYYHLGYWPGAVNHMGISPQKIDFNLRAAFQQGTTEYLLVNVANIREHLLGATALAHIANEGIKQFDPQTHTRNWCVRRLGSPHGEAAARLYDAFFHALPNTPAPTSWDRFPKTLHEGPLHILIVVILELLEKNAVSDAGYLTDAVSQQIRRCSLLNIIEEGQDQGFDTYQPEQMYFQSIDEFLHYVVQISEKLHADMKQIDDDAEQLARSLSMDGARFLRSHLAGQAAMMQMVAKLMSGVARAAQVYRSSGTAGAMPVLEETTRNTKAARTHWYAKYNGRFKDWPVATLFIGIDKKLESIQEMLAKWRA